MRILYYILYPFIMVLSGLGTLINFLFEPIQTILKDLANKRRVLEEKKDSILNQNREYQHPSDTVELAKAISPVNRKLRKTEKKLDFLRGEK